MAFLTLRFSASAPRVRLLLLALASAMVFFIPCSPADEALPPLRAGLPSEETENLSALQKEFKERYRTVYLSANKALTRKEFRLRVENGWDLFSQYCRFCHGYSEKPGERAEMLLNPALNDDGRLAKTPAEFFKRIYFGGDKMPPFGMGAHNGEIVAVPEGYLIRHGPRRLTPEEVLDIATYLQYCYQIPGSVKWKGREGKVVLDLSPLE